MGEIGAGECTIDSSSPWVDQWHGEARAARALAALKMQDEELSRLKEQLRVNDCSNTGNEQRLEKRLNHAEAKVTKLTAQLEANRRTSNKLTSEKLELQTQQRATQERVTHAETRVDELLGSNAQLDHKLKELKTRRSTASIVRSGDDAESARADLARSITRNGELEAALAEVKGQRERLSTQLSQIQANQGQMQTAELNSAQTLTRVQSDLHTHNETLRERERQLEAQAELIKQLQTMHGEAQNLLKQQDAHHKQQLDQAKKAQRKLVLFCQKLEAKRAEDKAEIERVHVCVETLQQAARQHEDEAQVAVAEKDKSEKECLTLRLELQQLLDEAQMSDSKRSIAHEERFIKQREQSVKIEMTMRQQQCQLQEQADKVITIEDELKSQMKYNKQVLQKCEDFAEGERQSRFKLKQADTQLSQLRKKHDTSESAVRGQMKRIKELELRLADAIGKLEIAEKARDKAILTGRRLRSEKTKMQQKIEAYEHQSQEAELTRIKARFKKHGVVDDDFDSAAVSDISINSKAIAIEIKLLRKSLKKLDTELNQYKKANGELREENEQLRAKFKSANEDNHEWERVASELKNDADKRQRSLNIAQERIRQLQAKVDEQNEAINQNELNASVNEKLKSAEHRLKNVIKDNGTLKQRVADITAKRQHDASADTASKAELSRLQKDLQRKRAFIDDLQQKLKEKEKQLLQLGDRVDMSKDDQESKSSQLAQSKRANDNLRRQIGEMKLEKDALTRELTTTRARLGKVEGDKARMDLALENAEGEVSRLVDRYDDQRQHGEVRQRQAIDLMESKLLEARRQRDEINATMKNIAELVVDELVKRDRQNQTEPTLPECSEKVCEILNLSSSELNSIMTVDRGDEHAEWRHSIQAVIDAGPPFVDTITHAFQSKFSDLLK